MGFTGIGGQGVQLAARTLAEAGLGEGRQVQMFASYGGMMRGGNSDSFVVVADDPIVSPPMPGRADSVLVMHHAYADDLWARLAPGGLAVVNSSVVEPGNRPAVDASIVEVRALDEATAIGAPMAASLVGLGALAASTGLVSAEALSAAAGRVLPSYRSEAADANRLALVTGFDLGTAAPAATVGTS